MPEGISILFVGQLDPSLEASQIEEVFRFYGTVLDVKLVRNALRDTSKLVAFVTYGSTEEADVAIIALHNKHFMGRDKPIQVTYGKESPYISEFGRAHGQQVSDENPSNPRPRPITTTACNLSHPSPTTTE